MTYPLRVLFVTDSDDKIDALTGQLRQGGFDVSWACVDTAVAMRAALRKQPYDVVIAFSSVEGLKPPAAFAILHQEKIDLPLIMIVAPADEEKGMAAMAMGVQDYVTTDTLPRLAPIITRELKKSEIRQERQQRQRALDLLYQITKIAASVEDVALVLGRLARHLRELLEADVVSLFAWDRVRAQPAAVASHATGASETAASLQIESETRKLLRLLLQQEQTLIVPDIAQTTVIPPQTQQALPFRSFLAIPLSVSQQKVGAALIGYYEKRIFTSEDLSRTGQATGQIALAMARTELLVSEREQRELAETLREVATALSSSLEREEVLVIILEQLMRVVDYDSASIMLLHDDILQSVAHRSIHTEVQQSTALPVNELPHIQQILLQQRPLIIADTAVDIRWRLSPGTELVRCWLGVPLMLQEQVIGLLNVNKITPGFYSEQDARVATTFAGQAAIAIENARLYAQQQAYAFELEARVAARTQELQAANARLQELDRLKSKFVTDVSHELRTPVTNLRLYLDLLARTGPEKHAQYLEQLQEQAVRLSQLISNIMDLSRLEEEMTNREFAAVSLNAVVHQVVEAQRPQAQDRNLQLVFTPDLALPPVWGNEVRLSQVVTNLLTNAINYTMSGYVTVETSIYADNGTVCLEVQDTGVGIDPDESSLLFDRFYRGAHSRSLTVPGTGLGLAIVKEIVELHQGCIEVESNVGVGSTFRILLPAARR